MSERSTRATAASEKVRQKFEDTKAKMLRHIAAGLDAHRLAQETFQADQKRLTERGDLPPDVKSQLAQDLKHVKQVLSVVEEQYEKLKSDWETTELREFLIAHGGMSEGEICARLDAELGRMGSYDDLLARVTEMFKAP